MSKQGYRKRKWGEAITRKTVKLPVNTVEKLKLLQSLFEEEYGCPMPYDEILDRLMSSLVLGKLNPRIYAKFQSVLNARTELDEVVKHSTKKAVDDLSHQAEVNGTTLVQEAVKAQEDVARHLASVRSAGAELSPDSESAPPVEEKERWRLEYFFVKGKERILARFSKGPGSFACTFYNTPRGYTFMSNRGWHIEDELGRIIDDKTALVIKKEFSDAQQLSSNQSFWDGAGYDSGFSFSPYLNRSPEPQPKHSYKFVGQAGKFDAYSGAWGIACYINDEELTANEMFNQGYKLVRDDGKEFTSLSIKIESVSDHTLIDALAFRLTDFDTQ